MKIRFWFNSVKFNHSATVKAWALVGVAILTWAMMISTPKSDRVLYSDQSTHVMIAASLWNDFDLRYSLEDLSRFRNDYPKEAGPRGLLLKQGISGDLYYAKPFLYGMVAAPLYAILGVDGFVVFNTICLVVIGVIVGLALTGPLGVGWATFASLAFVVPSAFLPWVFVAHPDLFIAALLAMGSYLLLSGKAGLAWHFVAALILGMALNEKITFLVVIPFVLLAMPPVDRRHLAQIVIVILFAWLLFTCVNLAVDGSILSYQGVRFSVEGAPFPLESEWITPTKRITDHVFDPVAIVLAIVENATILPEKIVDFLVGRQTGIVPYFPLAFGLLFIRPFFAWSRTTLLLTGFFSYLALNWLVFPTNGYGGAGSFGSRYMMQALPLIPISYLGARPRILLKNSPTSISIVKLILCACLFFALIIQHRIFTEGHQAVMHHHRVITTAPLNAFRLEKWLLPTTLGANASSQYFNQAGNWQFRIYKTDATNQGSWLQDVGHSKNLTYVLYKRDSEDKFPSIGLRSPIDANIRILNSGHVVWTGALLAAQTQVLDIDSLVNFRSAFDLLGNRHTALAELVIEFELEEPYAIKALRAASLDFETSTPPVLDADGERLSVVELVSRGADLRTGWSQLEPWGVWSDGDIAGIYLRVGEGSKFVIEIEAHAFVPALRKALKIDFRCSGSSPGEMFFGQGESKSVQLVCEKAPHQEYLAVTVVIDNPSSPSIEGQSTDSRRLGLGMKTFKIERVN